jgi:hypothetical protein
MGLFRASAKDVEAGRAAADRRTALNQAKAEARAQQRREAAARAAIARASRRAR